MTYKIGLIGNANVGKTTLFNMLTHSDAKTGNWHGVTNSLREKDFDYQGETFNIVDLPGIYSLTCFSLEEIVSRNFLLERNFDLIINVVDANNLARNLYLTTQLMEMGVKMVLAVNMVDELNRFGKSISTRYLESQLGIPIVAMSAERHSDVHKLCDEVLRVLKEEEKEFCFDEQLKYLDKLPINEVIKLIGQDEKFVRIKDGEGEHFIKFDNYFLKWLAVKCIEKDSEALGMVSDKTLNEIFLVTKNCNINGREAVAKARYDYIDAFAANAISVRQHKKSHTYKGDKVDALLLNKYLAIPMFFLIMLGVIFLTFGEYMPGTLLNGFFEYLLVDLLGTSLVDWLIAISSPAWFVSLIQDGIIGGVGSVLSFLPQIVMMFLALSIMEDTGYLSRVAFAMDGLLRKFGLTGRSVYSLLMGFGCTASAIMTTKGLDNKNAKIKTAVLTPYMSCTAKMPVYLSICAAFFVGTAPLIIFMLYALGIVLAVLLCVILNKTKLKVSEQDFIMEMPLYRMPRLARVLKVVGKNAVSFLIRVGTVIFAVSVVSWLLTSFSFSFEYLPAEDIDRSILAGIGNAIKYIFVPLGFGTWQGTVAVLVGLMGKEAVVSTLQVLYPLGIETAFTALSAFSLLVFVLLYIACIPSLITMRKEIGWKWTLFSIVTQLLVAYVVSCICYWVGYAFIYAGVGVGFAIIAGIAIACYVAVVLLKYFSKKGKKCAFCQGACDSDCDKCRLQNNDLK